MQLQKNYLENESIETIYFGGGTPSLLSCKQIEDILNEIQLVFPNVKAKEITIEANPDDINFEYLSDLRKIGVNRISIGIQSFNDVELLSLNRRHNSAQAEMSVKMAQDAGFENISIDLIFGLFNSSIETFEFSLNKALSLNVQHISAYHLTYESNTSLYKKLKSREIVQIPEQISEEQYLLLIEKTKEKGFIQYEISNFALDGFFSNHNSNYWKQKPYLGLGPSAHSYNLKSRQWNSKNFTQYYEQINKNALLFEKETLDKKALFNEYLMTRLRTIWGAEENYILNTFGENLHKHFTDSIKKYLDSGKIIKGNSCFRIKQEYWFVSDYIITDLFV
jgi:oxygen-independent coproporphyrinogen-3 oxidase